MKLGLLFCSPVKIVKQHLNAGKDVNARGVWKRTPLHYALKKVREREFKR